MNDVSVVGPAWDLSTEYSSAAAPEIDHDLALLDGHFAQIEALNAALVPLLATAAELSLASTDLAKADHAKADHAACGETPERKPLLTLHVKSKKREAVGAGV